MTARRRPVQQVELVDIGAVEPHPDNPRQGDIGAICESIAINGWYGAVIVSRRTDGTDVILAGEHRWRALTALQRDGWTGRDGNERTYAELPVAQHVPTGKVPVMALADLDETAERRILLADNRANDLSTYDGDRLTSLLSTLASSADLVGTLYDGDDLDALLSEAAATAPLEPMVTNGLRPVILTVPSPMADKVDAALTATGLDRPAADEAVVGAWLAD